MLEENEKVFLEEELSELIRMTFRLEAELETVVQKKN